MQDMFVSEIVPKHERFAEILVELRKVEKQPSSAEEAVDLLKTTFKKVENRYKIPFEKRMWVYPLSKMYEIKKLRSYIRLYKRNILQVTYDGSIYVYDRPQAIKNENFLKRFPLFLRLGLQEIFSKTPSDA